jgi:hypothetical protein
MMMMVVVVVVMPSPSATTANALFRACRRPRDDR